jgi:hypothetical protein
VCKHIEGITRPTLEQNEGLLETPSGGIVLRLFAQMPLASYIRVVTGILQQGSNGHDPLIEVTLVTWLPNLIWSQGFSVVPHPCYMIVGARNEHGASGRAGRSDVEVCEPDSRTGEAIKIRSADLSTKRPDIGVPHVVDDDEQDILSLGTWCARRGKAEYEERQHWYMCGSTSDFHG